MGGSVLWEMQFLISDRETTSTNTDRGVFLLCDLPIQPSSQFGYSAPRTNSAKFAPYHCGLFSPTAEPSELFHQAFAYILGLTLQVDR